MNVKIEINTQLDFNKNMLKSSLEGFSKDALIEIKDRLQTTVEIVQEVIDTPTFKKGDYVRSKTNPLTYGIIEQISLTTKTPYAIIRCCNRTCYTFAFTDLEIYTPKKGELCIFWDTHFNSGAIIRIFKQNLDGAYVDFIDATWDKCMPFISEEQFKKIINYDSQS